MPDTDHKQFMLDDATDQQTSPSALPFGTNVGGLAAGPGNVEVSDMNFLPGKTKFRIPYRYQDLTTNVNKELVVQSGWNFIVGDGTTTLPTKVITFSTAFKTVLGVFLTCHARKTASDPTAITDTASVAKVGFYTTVISTTSITVGAFGLDGTYAATDRVVFSWLVIGVPVGNL